MSDFVANVVGLAAGTCSIYSFVPQIVKMVREKDASGVSLGMFAATASAFVLWTSYGVLKSSWPIAVSNAICLLLATIIVALRLKFGDTGAGNSEDK